MTLNRREYIRSAGVFATGILGLNRYLAAAETSGVSRTPKLESDPNGILDLPPGFEYQMLSRTGESMDDGLRVPGLHDGMIALQGKKGLVVLIRNHEVDFEQPYLSAFGENYELLDRIDRRSLYDPGRGGQPAGGGTTTLLYDTQRRELRSHF